MRLTVRKDRCPVCPCDTLGWIVSDSRGVTLYYSLSWRRSVDFAYAVFKQPATGVVQVEPTQTHTRKALLQ